MQKKHKIFHSPIQFLILTCSIQFLIFSRLYEKEVERNRMEFYHAIYTSVIDLFERHDPNIHRENKRAEKICANN